MNDFWEYHEEDREMQGDLEESLVASIPVSDYIPTLHIIHGIRTVFRRSSFTHIMADEFKRLGYNTEEEYYGNLSIFGARWRNASIADELFDKVPDGRIIVAHSNAAALTWMLDQRGKKFAGVILIQPALDRDKYIENADWVDVYFNEDDCAVSLSRLLLFHPWGPQGKDGPKDPPVHYSIFDTLHMEPLLPKASRHNWYRDDAIRKPYVNFMSNRIKINQEGELYG